MHQRLQTLLLDMPARVFDTMLNKEMILEIDARTTFSAAIKQSSNLKSNGFLPWCQNDRQQVPSSCDLCWLMVNVPTVDIELEERKLPSEPRNQRLEGPWPFYVSKFYNSLSDSKATIMIART